MTTETDTKLVRLRQQLEKIQTQISKEEAKDRSAVLDQIKTLMAEHGLTTADIGATATSTQIKMKAAAVKKQTVAAKFQDPKSGATWSGRGREPLWIKGKKRERFLIGA